MSEENKDRIIAVGAVALVTLILLALSLSLPGCLSNPSLLTIKSGGKTTSVTPQDVQVQSDLARLCRELAVRGKEIAENMHSDPNPENQAAYTHVLQGIVERLEFCRSAGAYE